MLKWYCASDAGHTQERPCINYQFMLQLRAAKDSDARKAVMQARTKTMPQDDAGRKKLAYDSKAGYMKMYKAYCFQSKPANPEVCTNEALKKAYALFAALKKSSGA